MGHVVLASRNQKICSLIASAISLVRHHQLQIISAYQLHAQGMFAQVFLSALLYTVIIGTSPTPISFSVAAVVAIIS